LSEDSHVGAAHRGAVPVSPVGLVGPPAPGRAPAAAGRVARRADPGDHVLDEGRRCGPNRSRSPNPVTSAARR
jgi:hypothetical protein